MGEGREVVGLVCVTEENARSNTHAIKRKRASNWACRFLACGQSVRRKCNAAASGIVVQNAYGTSAKLLTVKYSRNAWGTSAKMRDPNGVRFA